MVNTDRVKYFFNLDLKRFFGKRSMETVNNNHPGTRTLRLRTCFSRKLQTRLNRKKFEWCDILHTYLIYFAELFFFHRRRF